MKKYENVKKSMGGISSLLMFPVGMVVSLNFSYLILKNILGSVKIYLEFGSKKNQNTQYHQRKDFCCGKT